MPTRNTKANCEATSNAMQTIYLQVADIDRFFKRLDVSERRIFFSSATSSDNIGLHHKIIKQITKSTLINLWPVIQLHTQMRWCAVFFHRGGWYHRYVVCFVNKKIQS